MNVIYTVHWHWQQGTDELHSLSLTTSVTARKT